MDELNNYYIKTNRTFTTIRKFAWIFTFLVAIGGLWEPRLGVLVVCIMAGLLGTSFFFRQALVWKFLSPWQPF